MPYASDAQRRYMHWAEDTGKIKKSTVDEYDRASKGKDLPERVGKGTDVKKYGSGQSKPKLSAAERADQAEDRAEGLPPMKPGSKADRREDAADKAEKKVGAGKGFPAKGGNPFQAQGPGVAPAIAASRNAVAADKGAKKLPPWLQKGKDVGTGKSKNAAKAKGMKYGK